MQKRAYLVSFINSHIPGLLLCNKENVPIYLLFSRVQRDIPMPLVSSGVEHGNLRELALARMAELGASCRDVRTREVGVQEIHHRVRPYEVRATELGTSASWPLIEPDPCQQFYYSKTLLGFSAPDWASADLE